MSAPLNFRPRMIALAALCALLAGGAPAPKPEISIEDVTRFYALYDAAGGRPTAEQLQRDYLDAGSGGLKDLARLRNVTGETMARAIVSRPQAYEDARACMAVLPKVRSRLDEVVATLARLYPQASFPPITIAVSRTKPVAMADAQGVRIGLEALCATRYMNPNIEDRFVHVVAHEYAHSQQDQAFIGKDAPTVLEASLMEGSAEFVAELISGQVGNLAPRGLAKGRELEIERRFVGDMDKTDLSPWLYNGANDTPGDLGYWVGYRITRAYYDREPDKKKALAGILAMNDAKDFLARSGWAPSDRP